MAGVVADDAHPPSYNEPVQVVVDGGSRSADAFSKNATRASGKWSRMRSAIKRCRRRLTTCFWSVEMLDFLLQPAASFSQVCRASGLYRAAPFSPLVQVVTMAVF